MSQHPDGGERAHLNVEPGLAGNDVDAADEGPILRIASWDESDMAGIMRHGGDRAAAGRPRGVLSRTAKGVAIRGGTPAGRVSADSHMVGSKDGLRCSYRSRY
jgi:hypothetical protein